MFLFIAKLYVSVSKIVISSSPLQQRYSLPAGRGVGPDPRRPYCFLGRAGGITFKLSRASEWFVGGAAGTFKLTNRGNDFKTEETTACKVISSARDDVRKGLMSRDCTSEESDIRNKFKLLHKKVSLILVVCFFY